MDDTSTTTTTDRPTSMVQAFEAVEASSASPPVTETPAVETPLAATAPATETDTPAVTETPKVPGAPPETEWPRILENARTKAAAEATAKLEQQYSGLKDFAAIPDQERGNLLNWYRTFNADPVAGAMQLIQNLEGNPVYAQQLRSLAARTMANGRGQQQAPAPEPEPDLQLPDGTLVFSAQRNREWRDWRDRQLEQKWQQQLQPLQQVAQSVQQQEAKAKATNEVSQALTPFNADPEFVAHKADVAKAIDEDPKLSALADQDPALALDIAWNRVWKTKVLPEKDAAKAKTAQTEVLSTLQQRAVLASNNPATATSATPRRPRSMQEAFEQTAT